MWWFIGTKHEFTFGHKAGDHNLIPMSTQVGLGMRLKYQSARTNLHKLFDYSCLFDYPSHEECSVCVGVSFAGLNKC